MGFWLLIPFFFIRFGLLAILNKAAMGRAAFFAPMPGHKTALVLYQLSNIALFLTLCFLRVKTASSPLFFIGAAVYLAGLLLLLLSVASFAKPAENGINQTGIYRLSRNPMYLAYFVFFAGCILLTRSLPLLLILCVFIATTHTVILAEEKWCTEIFGEEFLAYTQKVRRYV